MVSFTDVLPQMILMFIVYAVAIAIFGTMYGVVLANTNKDLNSFAQTHMRTLFIIVSILIGLLALLSYFLIKTDPTMFQPYALSILHISLLLSVLGVSISMFEKTN